MTDILIATHNKHKLDEFRALLTPLGFCVLGADDVALKDVEENGTTFRENSVQKALAAATQTGLITLADDSGLCIHALHNEPGIFSARYAAQNGGYPAVFEILFQRLKDTTDWSAHFECCLCLARPNLPPLFFEGVIQGRLSSSPESSYSVFGYDPIFIPEGFDKTFGALPSDTKNTISHRAKALEKLISYLKTNALK